MKTPNSDFEGPASLAELDRDEFSAGATPGEALFTTTQRRLLGLLYGQPDIHFHTSELIEITGSGAGATQRELCKLERSGVLIARKRGGRKNYRANPECPIFPELASLVRRTFGLVEPLRAAFAPMEREIEVAFVFDAFDQGSSVRPSLELLLVSHTLHAGSEGIDFAIDFAYHRLRRAIRVLVVGPEELHSPRWFLEKALAQPRTWVFGDEARLAAITSGP